jgi:hypothetical protein
MSQPRFGHTPLTPGAKAFGPVAKQLKDQAIPYEVHGVEVQRLFELQEEGGSLVGWVELPPVRKP